MIITNTLLELDAHIRLFVTPILGRSAHASFCTEPLIGAYGRLLSANLSINFSISTGQSWPFWFAHHVTNRKMSFLRVLYWNTMVIYELFVTPILGSGAHAQTCMERSARTQFYVRATLYCSLRVRLKSATINQKKSNACLLCARRHVHMQQPYSGDTGRLSSAN